MYTHMHEEESSPLLCGFTAMLFGSMPLAYEDSVKVKMVYAEIIHYLIFLVVLFWILIPLCCMQRSPAAASHATITRV